MIKAFAMQIAITAVLIGVFALMDCAGVGLLVGIGYFCASSENLSEASKDGRATRALERRRE